VGGGRHTKASIYSLFYLQDPFYLEEVSRGGEASWKGIICEIGIKMFFSESPSKD
jgi:hypothetical protein